MKESNFEWGGSGIEKCTFDFISELIPHGNTVIELGAGKVSTKVFSEIYNLISVEHNPEFMIYPDVKYIHAEIIGNWYDRLKLLNLPQHEMVFIDGTCREGILDNIDLFNPNATYIVHDTYRPKEYKLCEDLAKKLGKTVKFISEGDFFGVIC
jgi:hypothetical protein